MKLTRKKAIELCIELWTWLAETGKFKEDWPEWKKYSKYNIPIGSGTLHKCWFCEYDEQNEKCCKSCLLIGNTEVRCYDMGYCEWEDAKTPDTRKKYAQLFLNQIKKSRQRHGQDRNIHRTNKPTS